MLTAPAPRESLAVGVALSQGHVAFSQMAKQRHMHPAAEPLPAEGAGEAVSEFERRFGLHEAQPWDVLEVLAIEGPQRCAVVKRARRNGKIDLASSRPPYLRV